MPALTMLGKKIKLSIAHKTLTFYPDLMNENLFDRFITNFNTLYQEQLEIARYIRRYEPDHSHYHDDSFDKEHTHYHMQFKNPIDPKVVEFILNECNTHFFIGDTEKDRFMSDYNAASEHLFDEIDTHLATLESKAKYFKSVSLTDGSYQKAAKAASDLCDKVSKALSEYKSNRTPDNYISFKKECVSAIEEAEDELSKHRGLKKFLVNLGAAVLGLGVFYLVAASINYQVTGGQHFFFQVKTDSQNRLDEMKNITENLLRL